MNELQWELLRQFFIAVAGGFIGGGIVLFIVGWRFRYRPTKVRIPDWQKEVIHDRHAVAQDVTQAVATAATARRPRLDVAQSQNRPVDPARGVGARVDDPTKGQL